MVVGEGFPREPPRNRSPWARLCLLSPRCERRSLPQERNNLRPNSHPRRSGQSSTSLRIRRSPLRLAILSRRLRRASFFVPHKERGERNAPKGTSSERTSLAPFPQNRNTAKTPYRSVAPPLQIETQGFDLRRTFRRNLQAATKGSCAVFRRIRTRTPSPTTKGAAAPIGFPGVYEGRETGDWTGVTDCHSPCGASQ